MYNKNDARMTQGFAILCMLCLHLFCREAPDLPGKALIWLNSTTPLLCWIGFFSEICVPLYSMTAGYAYMLLYDEGKQTWNLRWRRAFKLIRNYWIILVVFVIAGILMKSQRIPGSFVDLIGNITLLSVKSYNGTWLFLKTYLIIMLLPPILASWVPSRLRFVPGILFCFSLDVIRYVVFRFGILSEETMIPYPINFLYIQFLNLWHVLPFFWIGGLLYKNNTFSYVNSRIPWLGVRRKVILLLLFVLIFVSTNIIHKAVLMGFVAMLTFLIFNLWEKGRIAKNVFSFLGEHSTNIWLSHMFFVSILFGDYIAKINYGVLVLFTVLLFCLVTSYVEKGVFHLCSLIREKVVR